MSPSAPNKLESTVFKNDIPPAELEKILVKDWYRHGVYRDNILFASVYLSCLEWDGRPWSFKEYDARIQTMRRGKKKLQEEARIKGKKIAEAKRLIQGTRDARAKRLLRNIQHLIYLKTHRIDVYTESWGNALGVIDRICERINLSYRQLLCLTLEEILWCLGGNTIRKAEIEKRNHALVARIDDAVSYYYGDAVEKIKNLLMSAGADALRGVIGQSRYKGGAKGRPEILLASAPADAVQRITGQIGYRGIARGPARVLLSDRDLPKLERGDILVANLTNPNGSVE